MPVKSKVKPLIDQRLVQSLAHPLRVELLDALSEQVASPNGLSQIIGSPLSHVSYHMRVLEKFGSIELLHMVQRRGASEHFYRAVPDAFVGSPDWRRVPRTLLRAVSGAAVQSFLDKVVRALEKGNLDKEEAAFIWVPVAVDEKGKREVAEICEATIEALEGVQKKSTRRLGRRTAEATPYLVAIAGFETAGD